MQFNTFVSSISELEQCVSAPSLQEVLLEPLLLARQGQLCDREVFVLAQETVKRGLRPVLVWDALMPEREMALVCEHLNQWELSCFGAIRVCDPGAAQWLTLHAPEIPLQLIVETGNHNLASLRGWCEIFANSLERLVLSIELPEATLMEYCRQLPVACEILGVGPILLFYSPRSLLAKHSRTPHPTPRTPSPLHLEATATAEETRNRPFPILETPHGTFMFLDKDQFILDKLDALCAAGLHTVRLDLRHLHRSEPDAGNVAQICRQALAAPVLLRASWPKPTCAPFFNANRTTALFPRLKSKLTAYRDEACLAEIVTGENRKYVVFHTLRSFAMSQVRSMVLPTGEQMEIPQGIQFRNLSGQVMESCEAEQLLLTDWIKKAMPGSLLLGDRRQKAGGRGQKVEDRGTGNREWGMGNREQEMGNGETG